MHIIQLDALTHFMWHSESYNVIVSAAGDKDMVSFQMYILTFVFCLFDICFVEDFWYNFTYCIMLSLVLLYTFSNSKY